MKFESAYDFYRYRIFNEIFRVEVDDLATRSVENIRTWGTMRVEDKTFAASAKGQTSIIGVTIIDLVYYDQLGVEVLMENDNDRMIIHGYVTGFLAEWHILESSSVHGNTRREEELIRALTDFSMSVYKNLPEKVLAKEEEQPLSSIGLLARGSSLSPEMRGQEKPFKKEDYQDRYGVISDGLKRFY